MLEHQQRFAEWQAKRASVKAARPRSAERRAWSSRYFIARNGGKFEAGLSLRAPRQYRRQKD
jgi:hypothetical protein